MEFIYSPKAEKQLEKLGFATQKQISKYVANLETLPNPRQKGKALTGNLKGLWRYRVQDYRLICHIQDKELIILCLEIDHRSKVYE
ncbi:addiction module toxin RelE [Helicobacter sp. 12S02634-8]|uniref:type II toxin-antitoxin system RelE family toxin n=1 Tax=Helicobacter sp. 12S02634-8 TaxID=1476199 RepID=UPI000BA78AEA|nr:type II toxin-antitoxin system RelE/ParE family toxin [Helicobacter sp. 12S02634-8]PAF46094.1 addiction module toxin RelE [Helicobacter sp. 12S02634-8]